MAAEWHKGPHAPLHNDFSEFALVFLFLEAMEYDRAVAEGAMDGRRPRVVLHHEWRVDELNADI